MCVLLYTRTHQRNNWNSTGKHDCLIHSLVFPLLYNAQQSYVGDHIPTQEYEQNMWLWIEKLVVITQTIKPYGKLFSKVLI